MKLWPWRVQVDPAVLHREAERLEAEVAKLLPREHRWEREPRREPFRTTAYVGEPIRELEP